MRDWLVFGFVLALAAGGALSLTSRDPGGRHVACASMSAGSWFAGEYCGSSRESSQPVLARSSDAKLAEVAAR